MSGRPLAERIAALRAEADAIYGKFDAEAKALFNAEGIDVHAAVIAFDKLRSNGFAQRKRARDLRDRALRMEAGS